MTQDCWPRSRNFQAVRQNRIREMVARLNELNVPLQAECGLCAGRIAVRRAVRTWRARWSRRILREPGRSVRAFSEEDTARPGCPKFKMSSAEAIDLIHQAGGVAVMAHPGPEPHAMK